LDNRVLNVQGAELFFFGYFERGVGVVGKAEKKFPGEGSQPSRVLLAPDQTHREGEKRKNRSVFVYYGKTLLVSNYSFSST